MTESTGLLPFSEELKSQPLVLLELMTQPKLVNAPSIHD